MAIATSSIIAQISDLPDLDKLHLVDEIMEQLDRPDPEMDKIWAAEAKRRWQAYKEGRMATVSYEEVMSKYRTS